MSLPDYPTDDGERDHETAAEEMQLEEVSPASPTFFAGESGEVIAAVGIDTDTGEVTVVDPTVLVNTDTWTVNLPALWEEWVHGSLNFRSRKFLRPEEETYNSEYNAAIAQRHLAELADTGDRIVKQTHHGDCTPETELAEAIRSAYTVLEFTDGYVTPA